MASQSSHRDKVTIYRKFVWVCVCCGAEEIDLRPTVNTVSKPAEIIKLIRCDSCTKRQIPLNSRRS